MFAPRSRDIDLAIRDLAEGISLWRVWLSLGWQDIRRRYRRSTIGPFWLTLGMAVNIASIGFFWSFLFGISVAEFIPHLALGFLLWGLITGIVNEGCSAFTDAAGNIRQIRRPLIIYPLYSTWRNIIIFGHNFIVIIILIIILSIPVNANTLIIVVSFPLLILSVLWVAVLGGLISARYRDVPPIISSIFNVLFFLTPIIWTRDQLGERAFVADFNPLTHMIDLVRMPLLGDAPPPLAWGVVIGVTIIGWVLCFFVFARFRARIAYWL